MQFPHPRTLILSVLAGTFLVLVGTIGCRTKTIDLTGPETPMEVDYATEVQPIFDASCGGGGCHIQQRTNGVRLNTREAVLNSKGDQYGTLIVTPGDASRSASPLVDKILPNPTHGQRMPFDKPPLEQAEISTIRAWIDGLAAQN